MLRTISHCIRVAPQSSECITRLLTLARRTHGSQGSRERYSLTDPWLVVVNPPVLRGVVYEGLVLCTELLDVVRQVECLESDVESRAGRHCYISQSQAVLLAPQRRTCTYACRFGAQPRAPPHPCTFVRYYLGFRSAFRLDHVRSWICWFARIYRCPHHSDLLLRHPVLEQLGIVCTNRH